MAPPPTRTLVLMRHSKAEAAGRNGDHSRSLTRGGLIDARAAGDWLTSQPFEIERALCSSAARAEETAQAVVSQADLDVPIEVDDALYNAGEDQILRQLWGTDDAVRGLLVVGHNPGIEDVAQALIGAGECPVRQALAAGMGTSAIAIATFVGGWEQLQRAAATLQAFAVPRGD